MNLETPNNYEDREAGFFRKWLPRNWLYETRNQEFLRRIQALEESVQSAHERINELDQTYNLDRIHERKTP
jgi:hypothetical protein